MKEVKLLVIIDQRTSWSSHTHTIVTKKSRSVAMVRVFDVKKVGAGSFGFMSSITARPFGLDMVLLPGKLLLVPVYCLYLELKHSGVQYMKSH